MLGKVSLLSVCILAIVSTVHSKPVVKSGIRQCFKQECPEETYACERFSKLSEDKESLLEEIHCLGLKDNVLKNITTSKDNPFGPDVIYQGYSYSGAYQITLHSDNRDDTSSEVEKGDKSPNYGEAEDLNET